MDPFPISPLFSFIFDNNCKQVCFHTRLIYPIQVDGVGHLNAVAHNKRHCSNETHIPKQSLILVLHDTGTFFSFS